MRKKPSTPSSNIDLVRQAKEGNVHAFALLYEQVYKDLYRFALYTLRQPQDAEDAVSEAVTDAFSEIRELKDADAFRSWMFRILSVKCKRRIGKYALEPEELDQNMPAPEGNAAEALDVRQAFSKLNPEDRLILSMSLFAGYSSGEIGEKLHKNPATVRSRMHRALKQMQHYLSA